MSLRVSYLVAVEDAAPDVEVSPYEGEVRIEIGGNASYLTVAEAQELIDAIAAVRDAL